jgi:hypothetical protein
MSEGRTPSALKPSGEPDPVIEAYKKGVDRSLLRENLKLTPDERLRKLAAFMKSLEGVQAAAETRRR